MLFFKHVGNQGVRSDYQQHAGEGCRLPGDPLIRGDRASLILWMTPT